MLKSATSSQEVITKESLDIFWFNQEDAQGFIDNPFLTEKHRLVQKAYRLAQIHLKGYKDLKINYRYAGTDQEAEKYLEYYIENSITYKSVVIPKNRTRFLAEFFIQNIYGDNVIRIIFSLEKFLTPLNEIIRDRASLEEGSATKFPPENHVKELELLLQRFESLQERLDILFEDNMNRLQALINIKIPMLSRMINHRKFQKEDNPFIQELIQDQLEIEMRRGIKNVQFVYTRVLGDLISLQKSLCAEWQLST